MSLSNNELQMINIVVDRFMNLKEATPRKILAIKFRSPNEIDHLIICSVFKVLGDGTQDLLPQALGIACRDNPDQVARAKSSVEIVLYTLVNLYEVTAPRRQLTSIEVLEHARKIYSPQDIPLEVIELGLYFIQELSVLDSYGQGATINIDWLVLSEHIVTVDVKTIWDEHVTRRKAALNGITGQIPMTTAQVRKQKVKQGKTTTATLVQSKSPDSVWVIHGRDERLRRGIFSFLRAIGLKPLEFSDARRLTNHSSPYVGEILEVAFQHAQAVVVLLTPDDQVRLRPDLCGPQELDSEASVRGQARPNVLFEAGMAFSSHHDRTVLVQVGNVKPFSDVVGRHIVHLDGSIAKRQDLAQRLETAGCPVVLNGTDWHVVGDLAPSPTTPDVQYSLSQPPRDNIKELPQLRPKIVPLKYDRSPDGYHGLFVCNDGEPAFEISVGSIAVGTSRLDFWAKVHPRLTKEEGPFLFDAHVEQSPGVGLTGSGLHSEMIKAALDAITVRIKYKDGDNRWYLTICKLERDFHYHIRAVFSGQELLLPPDSIFAST